VEEVKTAIYVEEMTFDAAHVIPWHTTCSRLHGHTYHVRAEIHAEVDPSTQMILDFGIVKTVLRLVAEQFDHRLIINSRSCSPGKVEAPNTLDVALGDGRRAVLSKFEVVQLNGDATVENIAAEFATRVGQRLQRSLPTVEKLVLSVSEGDAKGAVVELPLYRTSQAQQMALPGFEYTILPASEGA
jgi:6-pyruvoyltetrahydropterin/6-carboxytetrahydropterin synthase